MFLVIILVAGIFRFWELDQIPHGLNSDEATNLLHMMGLMRGDFRISFGSDAREPLFFYLSVLPIALLDFQFFSMRITAALVGVMTIALLYLFARFFFRSRLIAAIASFLASVSVWHIFWSRYGLRAVLSVLLIMLALWWYWRALRCPTRRHFALTGVCTGLALYTYLSARLLPLVLILVTLAAMLLYRERILDYAKGLMLTGGIAFLIFTPLIFYYLSNVQDLVSHSANLSILDPRVNKGDLFATLGANITAVAGMFLVRGDHEAYRNIPNRPVFDPVVGIFFVSGLIVLLFKLGLPRSSALDRLRAIFLGVWLVIIGLASILSDDPPSFVRTLATMPAVMIITAWGMVSILNLVRAKTGRTLVLGALALLLIAEAGFTYRDYFIDFAPSGVAYYAFDGHVIETGNWVKQNAPTSRVFIAPLWYYHPTFQFITRGFLVQSFDSRDTVVLQGRSQAKDMLIVFPQEQEKKAERLGERLGGLGIRQVLPGAFGADYAIGYRIPIANLPDESNPLATLSRGGDFIQPQKIIRAQMGDAIEVLGYSIDATDTSKRNLEVTIFFRALKPISDDYTFSIKARDSKDRTWGQEDKWAGDNSYATTQWSPGDLIIEKFYPGLSACAPASDYRVSVEAYSPQTMQSLGDAINLGTWQASASQGNRIEDLEIEHTIGQGAILGYNLTPEEIGAGDPFSLSLFWRGVGDGKQAQPMVIKLRDSAKHDYPLAQSNVVLPSDGRGLCVLSDVVAPQGVSIGVGSILVNDVKIGSINIVR